MSLISIVILLVITAAVVSIGYLLCSLDKSPDVLPPLTDEYWGPGSPKQDDKTIKPFSINIADKDLQDLKNRLVKWRPAAEPLEGVAFQYGFHRDQLNKIIEYWRTKYDWRSREKLLNSLPQYKTQISGLDIHFLHVKPDTKKIAKGVEVVPLLLLHGWPGSVKEFYKMIPLLVSPRPEQNFVFEIIAPSLPGYGWSQGASKPGMSINQVGLIMNKLMHRLGFNKYYIQGGDWGSVIGSIMAVYFPQNILGYHSNMWPHMNKLTEIKLVAGFMFPWLFGSEEPAEKIGKQISHLIEESGYSHIQASKPDTIGAALSDSPAGLAAYILEKFSTWTNPEWKTKKDGGLSNYQMDDLLDNVMIYWLTNSITTSMRLYAETLNKKQLSLEINQFPIKVPTGCARFPSEVIYIPESIIKSGNNNLIRFHDMPKGGHFAAFEVPELLSEEIWQFTAAARNYHEEQLKKSQQEIKQKQKTEM